MNKIEQIHSEELEEMLGDEITYDLLELEGDTHRYNYPDLLLQLLSESRRS